MLKVLIHHIIVFLLGVLSFQVCAQQLEMNDMFEKFNVNKQETFRVFQDSKGYIWVSTSPGVFRFDGFEFEEVSMGTPLEFSNIYLIDEDRFGDIWLIGKHEIFKFSNNTIKYIGGNKVHNDKKSVRHDHSYQVEIDSLNRLNIGNAMGFGHLIFQNGEFHQLDSNTNKFVSICEVEGKEILSYRFRGKDIFPDKKLDVKIQTGQVDTVISIATEKKDYLFITPRLYNLRNYYALVLDKQVCFINKVNYSVLYKYYDNTVTYVYEDSKGQMYVPVRGVNVNVYDSTFASIYHPFTRVSYPIITTIYEDNNKGLWLTSYNDGLFYSPSTNFERLEFKNEDHSYNSLIQMNDSTYALGGESGTILIVGKENEVQKFYKYQSRSNRVSSDELNYDKERNVLFTTIGFTVLYWDLKTNEKRELGHNGSYFTEVGFKSDSVLWMLSSAISVEYNLITRHYQSFELHDSYTQIIKTLNCSEPIEYVTKDGIQVYRDRQIIEFRENVESLGAEIVNVIKVSEGEKLFVLKSKGCVWLDNENQIELSNMFPELEKDVKALYKENDSIIWVGGNSKLYRLYRNKRGFDLQTFDRTDGLPKGEISEIIKVNNELILLINQKVWKFDYRSYTEIKYIPSLFIKSIQYQDSTYYNYDELMVEYSKSNVEISFRYLDYTQLGKVEYRYRLIGKSTEWIHTENPIANYSALVPSDYTFEVQAKSNKGHWTPSKIVHFSVLAPWYSTTVAKLIYAFILVVLMVLFGQFWSQQVKKRAQGKTKLVQLELKALKAQINPHFIFNSIASVQYFLSKNNPEKASEFLQDFADLIRKVLFQSDNNLVSLDSELKMLENYIKLESQKFNKNNLRLIIDKGSILAHKIQIPPTLIQPFVENSIWHGFKSMEEAKVVRIELKIELDKLRVVIEDNGIGRENAAKNRQGVKRKSYGMSITQNRIHFLNNNEATSFQIEDVTKNGSISGTRISFTVPFVIDGGREN